MSYESLNYPNIENCEIRITSSTGIKDLPPPSPDPALLEAMRVPLPGLYDFNVEKKILEKVPITEAPSEPSSSDSPINDIRRESLKRMMSITNASEDVCNSILEEQGYDMERAVNAFMIND